MGVCQALAWPTNGGPPCDASRNGRREEMALGGPPQGRAAVMAA
jgi:hypothetical protein